MTTLRKNIAEMAAYVPGMQPENEAEWVKLNTNENPYPPSPDVAKAILAEVGKDGANLRKYPDARSKKAREIAARLFKVDPAWVIMANGSDELLNNLIRAFVGEGERMAFVHPSYSYYATLSDIQGAQIDQFGLDDDFRLVDFPERYSGKLLFLTSPNAPLGFRFPNDYIRKLAGRCDGVLVVDEAYSDFADGSAMDLVEQCDNLIVTRTLSKSYSLAGMRLGLAVARPEVIAALDKIRDHYHLDRLALVAAEAALLDQDWLVENLVKIRKTREWFSSQLRELGYRVIPSQANFIFVTPPDLDAERVYQGLFERQILVRYFTEPLLKHGLRISIGTREEMETTLKAMTEIG
ncbi:histidinol-phosphate transaminase [Geopsychrobacter electrodiphilus]|uniref:histidinol-phosphate transaminase n=1 Tax=Geopsychrobacter electrodiphilus TaxID=225196 RepID=UPI00036D12A5|nr:histidinol-phosphate transaminase [Geopsychrobacter electrodiphilus]